MEKFQIILCYPLINRGQLYAPMKTAKDFKWLRNPSTELGYKQQSPIERFRDNSGSLTWTTDISNFKRNKHIDGLIHYARELVENKAVELT